MNEYTVALYVIGVHSIYSEWGIGIMSLYSPVNLADPRGRDSILETGAIDTSFLLETLPAFLASELAVRGACTVAVIVLLDGLSPDIQWRVGGILLAACGII